MSEEMQRNTRIEAELRLNTWLLPLFVGGFGFLYSLTGFRGWLILTIGSAGVWLLALLWAVSLRQYLRIERKLHLAWATVGDSLQEELKLVNHSWLPAIWVEIADASTTVLTPVRLVSDVGARSSRTRFLSHVCKQRGLYTLGPTRLRTSDPFGIYTLTLLDHHVDTILITPPVLPMSQLKIAPSGWAGDRRRTSGVLERQISDAGLRNYLPGDSLKRIHWGASAHFDELIVRQLEASASRDWWILVDLEAGVQAGEGRDSTLELSIVLAASLAIRGLNQHHGVGLGLAGPELVWLEPRADSAHRWRLLKALARAGEGDRSLADLLAIRRSAQVATVITITPSTDPNWIGTAGRRHRGGQVALLVDPNEFGGPGDQSKVKSALGHSGIPFHPMPRSLLEHAYQASAQGPRWRSSGEQTGNRYLKHGRSAWRQMG